MFLVGLVVLACLLVIGGTMGLSWLGWFGIWLVGLGVLLVDFCMVTLLMCLLRWC